jgi:hypothetical protein
MVWSLGAWVVMQTVRVDPIRCGPPESLETVHVAALGLDWRGCFVAAAADRSTCSVLM